MAKPTDEHPESFRSESRVDSLRMPPQSVEAEQSVIGGLMLAPDAMGRIADLLTENDFYRRDHRLIFRAIRELAGKNKPFDAVTLGEWFEAQQLTEQIGSARYLVELTNTTPSAANIRAYAEIVREKSLFRQAIEAGTELVNAGFSPEGKDASELLTRAQTGLATLAVSATSPQMLRPADMRALSGALSTPPRFVMAPYFPRSVVTLFGGHGGIGKSLLALIFAAHVAAGRWWSGHQVETGKVTMYSLEDDASRVGYRLQRIVEAYNLDAEKVFANLRVFDWSEGDTALVVEKAEFGIHTLEATPLFTRLKVSAAGSDLVLIDNASDAFDGNENSRRQVRAFFHMLKTAIAMPNDAAVVLLAHIDKTAARYGAAGNSYSGATAWHNSARSRLALLEGKDDIELRQEKSNFGKSGSTVNLRWNDHGVLMPCAAGESTNENEGQDSAGVLAAIRSAAVAGTPVGTGRSGPGNTHQVLSTFGALPARLKSAKGRDAFWAALDALLATGRIVVEEGFTSSRNRRKVFVESGTQSSLFNPPHPLSVRTHELTSGVLPGRGLDTSPKTHETHETHEPGGNAL
jgi:hypothetical protein